MYSWKTVLLTIVALVGVKIWSPYLIDNVRWSYFDVLHETKEKVDLLSHARLFGDNVESQ